MGSVRALVVNGGAKTGHLAAQNPASGGAPSDMARALALHGFQRHTGLKPSVMVPALLHVLISKFLETSRRQIVAYVTVRLSGSSSPGTAEVI